MWNMGARRRTMSALSLAWTKVAWEPDGATKILLQPDYLAFLDCLATLRKFQVDFNMVSHI
jgi:hypothetical protein